MQADHGRSMSDLTALRGLPVARASLVQCISQCVIMHLCAGFPGTKDRDGLTHTHSTVVAQQQVAAQLVHLGTHYFALTSRLFCMCTYHKIKYLPTLVLRLVLCLSRECVSVLVLFITGICHPEHFGAVISM